MTHPSRLLDSEHNPAARALLEAGLPDAPSPDAARRTALALGLSASALATVVSGSAGAALGGVGPGLSAPATASSLWLVAGQWLAVGAVAGIGLAGGAVWLSAPAQPTRTQLVSAQALPVEGPRLARAASPAALPAPNDSSRTATPVEDAPSLAHAAPVRATSASSAGAASTADDRLAREVALIDAARRALGVRNAPLALRTLDQYDRAAQTGTLDREARILRIDALVAEGQRAAAVTLARAYLDANPRDPHAPKLQHLIDSAPHQAE